MNRRIAKENREFESLYKKAQEFIQTSNDP